MIALHFEGLLSQQRRYFTVLRCSERFSTAEHKQRSTLGNMSTTAIACFNYGDYKLNAMRCKNSSSVVEEVVVLLTVLVWWRRWWCSSLF